MDPALNRICKMSKKSFDLTSDADQTYLFDLVRRIDNFSLEQIIKLGNDNRTPLSFRIAAKIADSKDYIDSCHQELKIGVVFAMWGEQNRLQKKNDSNPNGEDLLNVKVEQLAWLFNGSKIDWKLYVVDDGCPHGSGDMAE